MAKVKFELSLEKLTFKFEGDQSMGLAVNRAVNHTFGSLVEAQNRVIDVTPHEPEHPALPAVATVARSTSKHRYRRPTRTTNGDASPEATDANGESSATKAPRGRRARGDSFREQLYVLLREKHFAKPQTATMLRDELSRRGHNYDPKNIASDLLWLVKKKFLSRQRNGEGVYEYVKGTNDDFGRG
jgi:hypothetical protein